MDRRRPTVSVVMPYYNNQRTLPRCLDSFCTQEEPLAEIIVVDDGEAPSAAALVPRNPPVPIRVLESGHCGQSAATNLGIRAARGVLIMATCADIVATPSLLRHHLEAHARFDAPSTVIGPIRYAPWLTMTPLLRYMDQPGVQFDFAGIKAPQNVPPGMLYAPNFSATKAKLLEAGLFDETFRYGFQDTDLGFKLSRCGVPLRYCEEASVWHDHPTGVRAFANRQRTVYAMWAAMAARYPEDAGKDPIRTILERFLPILEKLPTLIALGERHNDDAVTRGSGGAENARALQNLFATIDVLAKISGLLAEARAVADLLALSAAQKERLTQAAFRQAQHPWWP